MRRSSLAVALVFPVVLAGCTAPAGGAGTQGAGAEPPAGPEGAAWRIAELRDVRSGESFRVSDLRGRVVVLEPMAIWCINCAQQQERAREALSRLPVERVAYISLAVDPRETAPELARYAMERGFSWRFAVAPPEVSRSLAAEFGDIVLSPPSTPLIVLDESGSVVERRFGGHSTEQLVALVSEHLE